MFVQNTKVQRKKNDRIRARLVLQVVTVELWPSRIFSQFGRQIWGQGPLREGCMSQR